MLTLFLPAIACKGKTASPVATEAGPAVASVAAAASRSDPPTPTTKPVCRVEAQKVWTKGVSATTGLTAVELPSGPALGFAVGATPHVLTIARGGVGKLAKVTVDPGSAFARAPKAPEGTRLIWRVTPAKIEGATVRAFVDFHDELKAVAPAGKPEVSKTRRVVCGPADRADTWVSWEGPAYLDEAKHARDPLAALKGAELLKKGAPYKEVRTCRSFLDAKRDEAWIIGSELVVDTDDAKATAKANLFIEQGKNGNRIAATSLVVPTDPLRLVGYDVPVSHELGDGLILIVARAPGKLVALMVNHDKKPVGGILEYKGTYQMPDISTDGKDDVLAAALATGKDSFALRALRIPGDTHAMPASFNPVMTDDDGSKSESRPEFLRDSSGQRWMAYIEDADKGKGHLEIVPLTAAFQAAGKPHAVTAEGERATEARLFASAAGGFVVAYLRDAGGAGHELVTEDLSCEVKK